MYLLLGVAAAVGAAVAALRSAEAGGPVEMVEDELVDGGDAVPVGVGEPDDLLDLAVRLEFALMLGRVAGHADHGSVRMSVCLRVEGSGVLGGVGHDGDAELLVDFADQGFDVALAFFPPRTDPFSTASYFEVQ